MDQRELSNGLLDFYGSQSFYRHWLGELIYTEGAQFFAENAGGGAYWFLDIVATEVLPIHRQGEEFIVVKIVREAGQEGATLIADDGDGNVLWKRVIEHTDCPVGVWRLYLENDTLCLPSER